MSKWQPIETAPKNRERILVVTANRRVALVYWMVWCWVINAEHDSVLILKDEQQPTHWMPLPALPEEA